MTFFIISSTGEPRWFFLFRIWTAVLTATAFLAIRSDLALFYGGADNGLIDPELLAFMPDLPALSLPRVYPHLVNAEWFTLIYLVLCLLLATGHIRQISAALLLLFHGSLFTAETAFSYGLDFLCGSSLFYCLVFPAPPGPASLLFFRLHLCLIYFFGGLEKLAGPAWRNGEALYKALAQPGFHTPFKPDLTVLAAWPMAWIIAGWAVALLELCYPICIWPRATRRYWLWAIIGLHLGIALFMGLYFFAAIMILWNLAAFYYPYLSPTTETERPYHTTPSVHPSAGRQPLHKPGATPAG